MATGQTIINSALRKLGALGVGETPDATESAECLSTLNALLDSLSIEPGIIWAEQSITKAVSAALATMTIGSGATWDTTRPVKIISAQWIDSANNPYDISVDVPLSEFLRLSKVATTGTPTILNYEPTVASGTLKWYPTPSENGTMRLVVWVSPQTGISLSTTLVMPPGYERMLVYELTKELAPDYEITLSPLVLQQAAEAKAAIRRANAHIPLLTIPPFLPGTRGRMNILRDE